MSDYARAVPAPTKQNLSIDEFNSSSSSSIQPKSSSNSNRPLYNREEPHPSR